MISCSPKINKYFETFKKDCFTALHHAQEARKQGYDPHTDVEITLAETLAERVEGLISVIAPQIKGSGVAERIIELEEKYSILDWRVGMVIAHEIAEQKYCSFQTPLEAIEVGVRVGFAYVTLGVVSSPIEGLTSIEIKERRDKKGQFFRINYAGPIRNAGGTAASVSVLIADYVRKKMGYAKYDPTEKEALRCAAELEDYHRFVANLQYFPSEEESKFLMENIPVEIAGDPSEKWEVSNVNLKDLPRVETNNLRSGYCLIHSSCIPLKGPKLWKRLAEWGDEMEMQDWNFLEEFLNLQKKMKAKGGEDDGAKIAPDYTYIKDIVAGRPVFGHPLRPGAFRLRYGRSRASGYSGQAIHPATMVVSDGFIATGTQLKVERPGKAAAFTPCDTIEGPIVKLTDGSLVQIETEEQAREIKSKIEKIHYFGDVLVNYGDFFDRAHSLVPAGYCEEWWVQEVKKAIDEGASTTIDTKKFFDNPLTVKPTAQEAVMIAQETGTALHPKWTPFWKEGTTESLRKLILATNDTKDIDPDEDFDRFGIPYTLNDKKELILSDEWKSILKAMFGSRESVSETEKNTFETVQELSAIKVRDKSGIFIGSRMGRPEKAKMRKMTGSPHTLFPVGEQGGRLRCFQAALQEGYVNTAFPKNHCAKCDTLTPFFRCETCDMKTDKVKTQMTNYKGETTETDYEIWDVPIKRIFHETIKRLEMRTYPDLIKGVRGTSNRSHIPEHIVKGILRAKHNVHVNKDGTVRYDASEVTLTHFKPSEVGVSVERLKELGYDKDCKGKELTDENQVLELFPQDVVLPCCETPGYPDEACDDVLYHTTRFIDELLTKFYKLKPYYNLESKQDLVGHYIIGLAPHTSAGIVGRIIGFSKTQGFLAHPLFHAAMRRDCDGDESCFLLLMDAFLNFSQKYLPESRGGTMDAPLVLTYWLNPAEVDDMAFNVDTVWNYPLEFYKACEEFKKPWDVKLRRLEEDLGTPAQFEGMGFTHDFSDLNAGVLCSSYKTLPSMGEKMDGQLGLAKKIIAVDESDVATLIITKHFIRDTKGNLGKFSRQQFRCVKCNAKYRRPPLKGTCKACHGKIIFTITEGSVIKYLEPSLRIAKEFNVSQYLQQDIELTKRRVEGNFGKDAERQEGLGSFM